MICVFAIAVSYFTGSHSLVVMALLYIPVICGSALIIGPVQSFALSHLEQELSPYGVIIMSTGFQVAGCIGASLFTGTYSAIVSVKMSSGASLNSASGNGFFLVGILAAAFSLIGFVLALMIRRNRKSI